MSDPLSKDERSARMRLVKSKDTKPEVIVRQLCRELGYRGYRLHRKDLPGQPDIAFVGQQIAIFVHGCFWHGHDCHGHVRKPKSNQDYWLPKIQKNIERDANQVAQLLTLGWKVIIIWECETKRPEILKARLASTFRSIVSNSGKS